MTGTHTGCHSSPFGTHHVVLRSCILAGSESFAYRMLAYRKPSQKHQPARGSCSEQKQEGHARTQSLQVLPGGHGLASLAPCRSRAKGPALKACCRCPRRAQSVPDRSAWRQGRCPAFLTPCRRLRRARLACSSSRRRPMPGRRRWLSTRRACRSCRGPSPPSRLTCSSGSRSSRSVHCGAGDLRGRLLCRGCLG